MGLQVTDTTDRIGNLARLMSAPDAPTAWDLRCLVRERFVVFLQQNYPQCLPRTGSASRQRRNPANRWWSNRPCENHEASLTERD